MLYPYFNFNYFKPGEWKRVKVQRSLKPSLKASLKASLETSNKIQKGLLAVRPNKRVKASKKVVAGLVTKKTSLIQNFKSTNYKSKTQIK